ncbi:MAG TPA: thioesterase family protein [Lautropia sp.]|nr:thioesterase family protein [Lautropia sp.]
MSFAGILAAAQPLDDTTGFAATIPEEWQQGRTAYGGVSAALALEGAKRLCDDLPPLRSAQIAFVGPVSGRVRVLPRLLRRGRNATWISVEIVGEGGVGLVATFVFMHALPSTATVQAPAPPAELIPLQDAAVADSELRPAFLRYNFETRHALPKADGKAADVCLWVRLLDRAGLAPDTEILLVGDGLPPAVLPVMEQRGPVSSMTWQVNLLGCDQISMANDWWLLRSTADQAAAGNSSQAMMLWGQDGTAKAAGTQSVAVFA